MWTRIGLLSCALVLFGCGATQLPNDGTGGTGGGSAGTGGNGGGTGTAGGGVSSGGGGTANGGGTISGGGGGTANGGGEVGGGGGTANGGGGGTTGPVGASCQSVCDCDSGLVCLMNSCIANPTGFTVYCCSGSDCPNGSYCQSTDGNIQMCGDTGTGGGGGIGGGFPGAPDLGHGGGASDMGHHGGGG